MSEDRLDIDPTNNILVKPESIRTLQDVKTFIDHETHRAEVAYLEANKNEEDYTVKHDEWIALKVAQSGLEGNNPENTIKYFKNSIDKLESASEDLPSVAKKYTGRIEFYKQAKRLIKNDSKLKIIFREQALNKTLRDEIHDIANVTKEKALSLIGYQHLKVKEHFGLIKPDEFDELLNIDFNNYIKDNPPLNFLFSPEEELIKIRKKPHNEKLILLNRFKKKLAKQRDAWATCRIFIERTIEFNHGVEREKLEYIINRFKEKYGFSSKQMDTASELLDRFYEQRERTIVIRKQYPSDVELVKYLTGIDFSKEENFVISVGPMSIDIATSGINAGNIYNRSNNKPGHALQPSFAGQTEGEPPIFFTVINQDLVYKMYQFDPISKGGQVHEWEHIKNRFFRNIFEEDCFKNERRFSWKEYHKEQDPEIKSAILESNLRLRTKIALNYAKDEILATFRSKQMIEFRPVWVAKLFISKDGGPYDYLYHLRKWDEKNNAPLKASNKTIVKEYESIIEKAVKSLSKLIREGKYSRQEAVALLLDKQMSQWTKTINRQLGIQ